MTKKVGKCLECEREMYTNELDLCKRCFNDVGLEFLKNAEVVEEVEDMPNMEDLGIEESAPEATEEPVAEVAPKE